LKLNDIALLSRSINPYTRILYIYIYKPGLLDFANAAAKCGWLIQLLIPKLLISYTNSCKF